MPYDEPGMHMQCKLPLKYPLCSRQSLINNITINQGGLEVHENSHLKPAPKLLRLCADHVLYCI